MSKGKAVSVSSFFDLKSELAKQEAEFAKEKAAGKSYVVGGIKRPDKKPTVWQKQNKGVAARAQRDAEMSVSKPALDDALVALERKARLYDKLRRGKSGGLDEKQYDSLLVDFDLKAVEDGFESDSQDEDESLTVPEPPTDDDPLVDYQDEFGRTRTVRRSELPRNLAHQPAPELPEEDDPYIIRGRDINYFPTYQQSEEKIAVIKESLIEDPLNLHYDASKDNRTKGAAYYNFSGDKDERQRQMEDLKNARDETTRTRAETGAEEPILGAEPSSSTSGSRAKEKRKRELEERRRALEAKRRKVTHTESSTAPAPAPVLASSTNDPFAKLEASQHSTQEPSGQLPRPPERKPKAIASDSFSRLEVKFKSESAATDRFLASLEKEMHPR